jgi:hypothetical protein
MTIPMFSVEVLRLGQSVGYGVIPVVGSALFCPLESLSPTRLEPV